MLREEDLTPLDIPPGIVRTATQYQTKGRWWDGNLVRWSGGQLRPVGGWHRLTSSPLSGKARDMLSWQDNSNDRWLAIGTSSKLYVTHADSATVYDITPVGFTAGLDTAIEGTGYGGGNYGVDLYGTLREGGTFLPLAIWTLDNFGEYLVGCSRADGKIYQWTLATGTPAAVLSNAPTNCIGVMVTDQRHVLALGADGNPRSIKWSDKEDNNTWTPAADNEAGGFELQAASGIKGGCRVNGTNLIVTRTDAHVMTYVGQPFIYGRERLKQDCGTPAAGSLVSTGDEAFWLGDGCFWRSEGVTVKPMECDVHAVVFNESLNTIQIEKVVGGYNPKFGEITWFLPSNGSDEPDRYVTYSVREGWWSIGIMARTAWDAGSIFGYPHAVSVDGHLYRHEDEWTDNGAARYNSIYLESGVMEIGVGSRIGEVNQILPDEEQSGDVSLTFKVRMNPNDPNEYVYGPFDVREDGYTDCRFSGRQATMTLLATRDGDFSVGTFRLDVRPGARR